MNFADFLGSGENGIAIEYNQSFECKLAQQVLLISGLINLFQENWIINTK